LESAIRYGQRHGDSKRLRSGGLRRPLRVELPRMESRESKSCKTGFPSLGRRERSAYSNVGGILKSVMLLGMHSSCLQTMAAARSSLTFAYSTGGAPLASESVLEQEYTSPLEDEAHKPQDRRKPDPRPRRLSCDCGYSQQCRR
jgi:hypothetical protein